MSRKTALLLHTDGDPLLKAAVAMPDSDLIRMDLAELCSYIYIERHKTFPHVLFRSNASKLHGYSYVINRLFDINAASLSAHISGWGNLSPLWFYRAMAGFWPKSTVCYPWAINGASLTQLPLPTQWHMVAKSEIDIMVPCYIFGFGENIPDTSKLRDPIRKSIWSYFSWKNEDVLDGPAQSRNKFYVERPQGIPLLGARIGNEIIMSPLRGKVIPDPERLRQATRTISDLFNCVLCEILFYHEDDGNLTFYACSTRLGSIMQNGSAQALMKRWLAVVGDESKSLKSATDLRYGVLAL